MRAAFLRDILEHPDDDAPRLVYADWLEDFGDEHDRARAQLIRGLGGEKALSLLALHGHAWLAKEFTLPTLWRFQLEPEPSLVGDGGTRATFRRGFVDAVRCSCKDWLDYGAALVASNPVHTAVLFGCMEPITGPLPDDMRRKLERVSGLSKGPAALLRAGRTQLYAWVWLTDHEPTRRLKRLVLTDVANEVFGHIRPDSLREAFPGIEVVFAGQHAP